MLISNLFTFNYKMYRLSYSECITRIVQMYNTFLFESGYWNTRILEARSIRIQDYSKIIRSI